MSHTWEDYQVKLLDKDRAELGSLVNVHNLKGSQTEFGDYGSLLTFSININDTKASHFVEQQRHFIQVLRDGTKIFDGFTVKTARRYATTTQGLAEFIEVTCMPLSQVVGWRHGQPVTVPTLISSGRTADDGFKWLLERTHGATAPNSPTNATNRTLTGFTLEADESARAGNVTIDATGKNMYDLLLRMGARYEVDWWVEFDASWNMEFKTAYPRRGLDRTEGNGARTEVIFNDSADTVRSVNYGYDAGGAIDAVMNKPMTVDAENATMQTNWLYMETVIDTEDTEELEAELARRAVAEFYKSDFVERADLVWDPSDSVTGPHFGIGDEITYVNKRLGYGPHDAVICKITFEILANGEEKLALTLGDPIPDIFDKQKQKRRSQAADDYTFLSYWRRAAATNILWPTYSVSGAPDHVATTFGGDIRAYSDDRSTLKFDVDGATGNIWTKTKITFDNAGNYIAASGTDLQIFAADDIWLAPVDDVFAQGDALRLINATDLLVHSDAGGAVTVASIDGATGNTAWADAAQMTWESVAYRMPVDAPATGEALMVTTGTPNQLQWALPKPDAHDILSAYHGDTLAAGVSRGSIIYGNATPAWAELVKGADNTVLACTATDVAFEAITALAVTTVAAGTGLTGGGGPGAITINAVGGTGLTAAADAINLDNTAVVAAAYGDAMHVGTFTVDAQGRLTAAADVAIHNAVTLHATLATNLLGLSTQEITLDTQAANLVFSGPAAGGAVAPTFRALVAADLPAASNIWTKAAANVYTTTANDCVVPNAGTGTLGLVGDPWDMLYAEDITLADGGTIGQAAGPLLTFNDTGNILSTSGGQVVIGSPTGGLGFLVHTAADKRLGVYNLNGEVTLVGINDAINALQQLTYRASVHQFEGGDVRLYGGVDFKVYDGAPGNLMFEVDGPTGNATWTGAGTIGASGTDLLINGSGDDLFLRAADDIFFQTGGANFHWMMSNLGHLYTWNETETLGIVGNRCANVYSILGNFSGTLTTAALLPAASNTWDIAVTGTRYRDLWLSRNADIDGTLNVQGQGTFQANVDFGAGIDVTGNITVTGTVDSIDVYNHSHAVVGNTANYNPGGNASIIIESADPGSTPKYLYTADDGAGLNATWRLMYAHAQLDHLHAVSIESGIAGD